MKSKRRYLPLLLPLASILISGALVGHQYYRREKLARELAVAERELNDLKHHFPAPAQGLEHPKAAPHTHKHGE